MFFASCRWVPQKQSGEVLSCSCDASCPDIAPPLLSHLDGPIAQLPGLTTKSLRKSLSRHHPPSDTFNLPSTKRVQL